MIEALQLGKVDLYGDSYGSFFAQVFASRFPQLVRSVTLDSTYETNGRPRPLVPQHDRIDAGRLRRGLRALAGLRERGAVRLPGARSANSPARLREAAGRRRACPGRDGRARKGRR